MGPAYITARLEAPSQMPQKQDAGRVGVLAAVRDASDSSLEMCRKLREPVYVRPIAMGFPLAVVAGASVALCKWELDPQEPESPPDLDWQANADLQQQLQPRRRRRHVQLKLASHLQELESEDSTCVLALRRINKLGFHSREILSQHFSSYGVVEKVLLSCSHEKPENTSCRVRLRPSGLGFLVMERVEDAEAIFAQGEVQHVGGVPIEVRRFRPRREMESSSKDSDDDSSSGSTPTHCPSMSSCVTGEADSVTSD